MKINWGQGIFIFFTIFVVLMLTVLYLSRQKNIDLVTEDYYAEELKYQDKIEQLNNSNELGLEVDHQLSETALILQFPKDKLQGDVSGNLHIYRPSDAKLDLQQEISLDDSSRMYIERSKLSKGYYVFKFNIELEGKAYYYEKAIMI